jgi:hypothetical protein
MFFSIFIFCISLSFKYTGHSLEDDMWSRLQLEHLTGLSHVRPSWPSSEHLIIRDRNRTLIELPEEEICQELKPQGITNVKRFSIKKQGTIIK